MKIKWLGHASFLITSDKGVRIITDPYTTGGSMSYGEIKEAADAVTVSHSHGDHNNAAAVSGNPTVLKGPGQVKGVNFKAVNTFHDEEAGKKRGTNTLFCFTIDGINVCHLGDLGHQLSDRQVAELGKIDVLLIPVGGYYTIDAAGADRVTSGLKPRVVIPMHYKTAKHSGPISTIDDFLKGKKNVRQVDGSEVELKAGSLPASTEIIVLKPAL